MTLREVDPQTKSTFRDMDDEDWNRMNPRRPVDVATMIDSCHPLFAALQTVGIDVDLHDQDDTRPCRKCWTTAYSYLLMLFNFLYVVLNAWAIYKFIRTFADTHIKSFSLVYYSDQFMCVVIFVHFVRHRRRMNAILKEIFGIVLSSPTYSDATFRSTRQLVRYLLLAGLLFFMVHLIITVGMASTVDERTITDYLEEYLTFHSPIPQQYKMAVTLIFNLYYMVIIMSGVGIYVAFLIVTFHLLAQCYRQLNDDIRSRRFVASRHLKSIQRHHQEITNLVQQFNEAQSPLIFILVVCFILKMGTGIGTLFEKDNKLNPSSFYVPTLTSLARSIALFLVFTHSASKVNEESKKILDVLLNGFLACPTSTATNMDHHLTSLFVAHRMSVPIGITASDLFVINYGFLAVVASSLATYASFLNRM